MKFLKNCPAFPNAGTRAPKADVHARAWKAGRRFVCVLMLLVVGVGTVWGTSYRWGNPSVSANWNDPSVSNGPWERNTIGSSYTGTNNYPNSSDDIAYMTGGAGSDYIITLSANYRLKELHINSDKTGPFKITFRSDSATKRTITVDMVKFVFKQDGTVSDQIELVLDNVELIASNLNVNDTVDSNEAWGGTFKVSQPAGSNSAISVTNTLDIRTKDNVQTVIDFGTVPVSAGSIAVNKNELYGAEVKICTDASVTCGWLNIGDAAGNGNSATKTVFSGSGTITTANLDFPNANNHTLTVESGVTLGFSGGGSFYENSSGLITIDGGGTIDFANVTVVTANGSGVEQQGTNFGPELTIQNPPSPPAGETYTFTATGVESFDGSNTISVAIYSSAAKVLKYTFQRTSTGGNPQFSVNDQIVETGQATFSAGETKTWPITAVNASNLTEGDGFTFTIYRPDGFPLGSVTWSKGKTTWTGAAGSAGSGDWNTAGNWTNLSAISDLSGKDIELNPPLTNYPAISSDAGAKTLKIPGNTRVTQTAGTFSVESITATGSGFFKASGGTVLFNGTAGTWQSDVNGAESGKSSFVNVTVTAGKSLTLNSDMAVTGDFTVTSGASFSTGTNALVFAGNGTAAAPQKLTAAGVTVGAVTVKSGTVLELQDNLTVGTITVEAGASLLTNGKTVTATTITGGGSIDTLTLTGSTTIGGTLSIGKLAATGLGGKTLTINGAITVGSGATGTAAQETLLLTGSSTSSLLEVAGSGSITLNATQAGGRYLNVTGSLTITGGETYNALYSTPEGTSPSGWHIWSGDMIYIWTGAVNQDWNTAGNWNSGSVPDSTNDVEIPNVTNYPIIADGKTITLARLTGGFAGQLEIGDNVTLSVGSLSIGSWGTVTTGDNVVINCTGTQSDGTTTDFTGSGTLVANGSLKFVGAGTTSINTLTINGPASGSSDATFEYQGGNARISSLNMTGQVELKTGSAGTLSVVGTARATDNARLKVTESTGTVSFAYLQADTDKTLTLGSAVTVSGELINWGTVVLDAYPLTVNTYSAATGTVTINGPASGTAAVFTLTGTTDAEISALNVSGLAELKTTASGALKVTGTTQIIDDATLTLTSDSGAVTLTAVTVDEGKSLNLKNAVTLTALTNKGTIVLENGCDLTVPAYTPSASQADIISLSGTVALNVTGTVSTVTVTDSATLSGTFSCRKFTASGLGGKTLTLNGTATVGSGTATDALVLSGSSEASKLTVTGSGTIKLNKAQAGGRYLSVSTAGPFIKDLTGGTGCVYTATYSSPSSGTATEFNGWNLCPAGLIYKWTGAAGTTAWNTAGNWNTSMVPSERENDVEISAGCSVYPVSPSSELSINSLTVESGASVSVADGGKLRFVSYSGDGVIKLGTGNIEIRSAGTSCTIKNIEFTGTGTRNFAAISKVTLVNVKVPAGKTLRLTGNLTLTGELDNAGTVNTNGNKLTLGSYTDSSASLTSLIQIAGNDALALSSGGTGGTVTNLSFTANAEFKDITGFTFKNATIAAGKELKLSGALTFTGTVTNNGTLNIDNKAFTCASYSGSGSDRILSNGGILTAGGGTVKSAQLTGNSKVINNGTGNLVFTTVTVTADNSNLTVTNSGTGTLTLSSSAFTGNATLTAGGTGSMPVFTTVSVGSGKTLTLGSNLTVSDTLGNQGTIAVGPYALSFAKYTNTAATKNDALTVNGGSVTSTGTGTGSGYAVNRIALSGNASINKNGMGALKVTKVAVEADATLTVTKGGSATSMPELTEITVGSSSFTVGGSGFAAGTLTATDSSVTIGTGATLTVDTFTQTVSGSGKSLTVNGTLIVGSGTSQETFRLSGGGTGSRLSVAGTGTIKLNTSQVGGNYLSVSTSGPSVTQQNDGNDIAFTAVNSTPSTGAPAGWNICAGDLTFIWKGSADTNGTAWNVPENWSVHVVPNSGTHTGITGSTAINVEIPAIPVQPSTSGDITVSKLTVAGGMKLTLGGRFTVSGALTNSGTIDMKNRDLTCGSYADSTENGLIMLGTGTLTTGSGGTLKNIEYTATRSFGNISGLTIKNGTVDSGVALTVTSGGLTFGGTLTNSGTITQDGNLSVTGALTNNGTIDMQNYDLTCGSYADTSGAAETGGLIKLGTGTFNPGTGGTLKNIEFTATRSFENIANLTIINGILDAGKTLTVTSRGLGFGGIFDNNGTVNIGASALRFAQYSHSENTGTDTLTISGGSITSTGNGTGMVKISNFIMNGNAAVTNSGTGALRFDTATAAADAVLTANGSVVFDNLVAGADASDTAKLTLASDITAGNVIINAAATLDADKDGKNADPDYTGHKLYVSGDFINHNFTQAQTDNVVYRGFVPQSGEVIFTGSTRHTISGNIKFNDFTCKVPGARLVFDVDTTINVDHQIDIEGSAAQRIKMETDSTVEGKKWTLDVIWDVAAGTPEHPKPILKYVEPHKSISYSAILKGCLDNCVDDASDLRDSTNVNWFDDMPTILMTLAPVGGRQLFVMFSTEVSAAPGTDLRSSIALTSASVANLIDAAAPVTFYTGSSDKSKTAVVFGLTRDLTWNDLYGSDCLHVEIAQTSAVRVGTTRISYQQGVCHCTSDFAVNAARMLFGYDNSIDSSTPLTVEKGTNSVRTWDQSDPISNRLHAESDLLFQVQLDSSVPDGTKLEMIALTQTQLNEAAVGDNYSSYLDQSTRLWLPDYFQPLSSSGQTVPSAQHIAQDSPSSGRLRNYSLHYSASSSYPLFKMTDGEEIQFLFKVKNPDGTDLLIDHDYDDANGVYTPTPKRPVYAIRLVDDKDITSFDLWSVMLQSTTLQRGNVTILNNVINADNREQTFITIDLKKAGSLTVQVLTLDGSVITTLERGRKQPGTYGYDWDGTNGKGKPVARGMYFIRVIGPDIDETRKVMVVRN